MSVAEMKIELISKITSIEDEKLLQEVLSLVRRVNVDEPQGLKLSATYDRVKDQYGDVLQKLAQ